MYSMSMTYPSSSQNPSTYSFALCKPSRTSRVRPTCKLQAILKVKNVYTTRGFNIEQIQMDGAFDCLQDDLADNKIIF